MGKPWASREDAEECEPRSEVGEARAREFKDGFGVGEMHGENYGKIKRKIWENHGNIVGDMHRGK